MDSKCLSQYQPLALLKLPLIFDQKKRAVVMELEGKTYRTPYNQAGHAYLVYCTFSLGLIHRIHVKALENPTQNVSQNSLRKGNSMSRLLAAIVTVGILEVRTTLPQIGQLSILAS
jgi:hypothetical protein